jgi:hypothetical protein
MSQELNSESAAGLNWDDLKVLQPPSFESAPGPEFINRINNPEKYPFITNKDNSISTHRMAADKDKDGNWYAHPMIVQLPSGELKEYTNPQQALEDNLASGNVLPMKSKEEALAYAKNGYKLGTPHQIRTRLKVLQPASDLSPNKKGLNWDDLKVLQPPASDLSPNKKGLNWDDLKVLQPPASDLSPTAAGLNWDDLKVLQPPASDLSQTMPSTDTLPASDARDEFGYISEAEQDKEPWYLPTDVFRGIRHGFQTTKDVTGASAAAIGLGRERSEPGSGDALIQEGMAMVQRAEKAKAKIGYKKSDTFSGAWEEGIDEVFSDWAPYTIGTLIPMIAEAVATGFGFGKIAEKTGSKTASAIGKTIAKKAAGKLAAATNPVTGAVAAVDTAIDAAKSVRRIGDYIKKFVTQGAFKADIKKQVAARNAQLAKDKLPPLNKIEAKKLTNDLVNQKLSEAGTQALFRKRLGNIIGTQTVLQRYGQGEVFGRAIHEAIKNEPDPQLQLDLIKELPAAKLATLGTVHGLTDQLLLAALGKTVRGVSPKTRNALLTTAISTGKLSTQSGTTEVIQSMLERYGADLPLSDKKAFVEYLDSFMAGAVGVAPFGVAGGLKTVQENKLEEMTKDDAERTLEQQTRDAAREVTRRSIVEAEEQEAGDKVSARLANEYLLNDPVTNSGFNSSVLKDILGIRDGTAASSTLKDLDINDDANVQVAIEVLEGTQKPKEAGGIPSARSAPIQVAIDQLKAKLDPNYVPPESSATTVDTAVDTAVETGDLSGAYVADLDAAIVDIKANGNTNITQPRFNKILKGAPQNIIDEAKQRLREEGFFIGTKNAEKTARDKTAKNNPNKLRPGNSLITDPVIKEISGRDQGKSIDTNKLRPGEGLISDFVKETGAELDSSFDDFSDLMTKPIEFDDSSQVPLLDANASTDYGRVGEATIRGLIPGNRTLEDRKARGKIRAENGELIDNTWNADYLSDSYSVPFGLIDSVTKTTLRDSNGNIIKTPQSVFTKLQQIKNPRSVEGLTTALKIFKDIATAINTADSTSIDKIKTFVENDGGSLDNFDSIADVIGDIETEIQKLKPKSEPQFAKGPVDAELETLYSRRAILDSRLRNDVNTDPTKTVKERDIVQERISELEAQIPAETPAQIESNRIAREKALAEIKAEFNVSEQEARVILDAGQVIENTNETTESITESFTNQYGKNIILGIKRGLINIVKNVEDLANLNIPNFLITSLPAGAKAFVLDGKAYFIANRITRDESPGLLLHEIGAHYGLKRMLGATKYNELVSALKNKRNSDKDISAAFDYVTEAYPEFIENGDVNIDDPYFIDEVIARISESAPNNSLYRTIVANIKAFLRKLNMGWNVDNLSARQIQDLVQHSLKSAIKEKSNTQILPENTSRVQAALSSGRKNTPENKQHQEELRSRDTPEKKAADKAKEKGREPDEFFNAPGPSRLSKIGGAVFSFDSPLNTAIKEAMKKAGETFEDIKNVMYDMAVSQAVHAATLAERFLEFGGIRWNSEEHMFETIGEVIDPVTGKPTPLPSMLKAAMLARKLAIKVNVSYETIREEITRAFVARRVVKLMADNQIYKTNMADSIYAAKLKRVEAQKIKSISPEAAQSLENEAKEMEKEARITFRKNYVLVDNEQKTLVEDLKYFEDYGQDIEDIYEMMIASKNNALKFAVGQHLMSKEQFEELTGLVLTEKLLERRNGQDVFMPFYREGKDGDRTNQKGLEERGKYYKLRGSFEPVADVFDNMERFIQSTITRGIINRIALTKIKYTRKYLGDSYIRSLPTLKLGDDNVVEVSQVIDGKQRNVMYQFSNPYNAAAISGIESISIPGISMMASVSNLFRSNIILWPAFGFSQLSQDALSAMTSSGTWVPAAIPIRVIKNFVLTMVDMNKTHENARKRGITGGWAHLQGFDDIENNPDWLGGYNAFRRQLSKIPGLTRGSAIEVPGPRGKPLQLSVSGFLHRIAMASDNSIRESVIEQVMFETRIAKYLQNKFSGVPTPWKDTKGDAAQANAKALEVINFKRAGFDPRVTAVRRTVAFSGAMLQALSVQARVFTLQGVTTTSKAVAAGQLASGLSQVTMLTFIYYMLMSDDEEYKSLSDQEKMHYFYIPGMGTEARIRVRPDMTALLGKVFPEAYLDLQMGRSDVRAFRQAIMNSAEKIVATNFIPTIIQPIEEAFSNRSRFTERAIIPEYMEGRDAKNQYNNSTSEFAKQLGTLINVSPLWIDHLMKGYLGTTGDMIGLGIGTLLSDQDIIARPAAQTDRDRIASLPGNAAFFRKENYNARSIELIYDMVNELKRAKNFSSDLTRRSQTNMEDIFELHRRVNVNAPDNKDATKKMLINFSDQINTAKALLDEHTARITRLKERKDLSSKEKQEGIARSSEILKDRIPIDSIIFLRQQIYGSGIDANSPLTKRVRKLVEDTKKALGK